MNHHLLLITGNAFYIGALHSKLGNLRWAGAFFGVGTMAGVMAVMAHG